ncbi:MAG: DUF2138 family protein [Desulfobulbaceae bacterium]|jgi:uncharacterized protein YfaA (DUF2138 family)|nr:DUF2138 family protein [Desulfobulbaceae bacterium]
MPPSGKKLAFLLVILCLAGAACVALYNRYFPVSSLALKTGQQKTEENVDPAWSTIPSTPSLEKRKTNENIDLDRPAMLIRSSSLAKLPRDLLRLPVAKDLLTEDIVNYYEHHDGKLALSGSLRRIAYENKLQLPDRLIEMALDAPTEVALWTDGRGRLRHFALAMEQNVLARTIALLLPLRSEVIARQSWPEIQATSLTLSYGNEKLFLFTRGDRVVALSSGLLVTKAGDASNSEKPREGIIGIVDKLLAGKAGQPSLFAESFHLADQPAAKGHEIVIATHTLAFGYEHFMPGLAAFHLVFDDTGAWQSAVLINGEAATAAYTPLWRALPHGAAFCAALPVNWPALGEAAKRWRGESGDGEPLDDLLAKFGPAAACWYGDSRLYAPLFATASEKKLTEPEKTTLLRLSQTATKVKEPDESLTEPDGGMWRGTVPSAHGISAAKGEEASKRFFHPAAAVWAFTTGEKQANDVALFSPNALLLAKALDVAMKKFPAIADSATFPENEQIIAFINPAMLAELMRGEIFEAAPADQKENFRDVADFLFTPRLNALAAYAPQVVSFHVGKNLSAHAAPDWQWYPLRWNSLEPAKTGNASTASTKAANDEAIEP